MENKIVKNILSTLIVIIWGIISGYLCVGSLTLIDSIEKVKIVERKVEKSIINEIVVSEGYLQNKEASEIIRELNTLNPKQKLTFEDEQAIRDLKHVYWYYRVPGFSYIAFITILPYMALLFLGAGSGGSLGSVARIIIDHARNVKPIGESKFLSFPLLGFFMGIMVLSISYVVPSIFIKGESSLNIASIVLISFFAGIFSDGFYNRIQTLIERFFKSDK